MLSSEVHRHTSCARLSLFFVTSSWLFAIGPELAPARAIPTQKAQAPRTIILPLKVVAGAQATLAVIDAAGRLMPGVAVEISGWQSGAGSAGNSPERVATDSTGRALFVVPNVLGPVIAKISGQGITASSVAVTGRELAAPAASEGEPAALSVTSYPRVLAIHDRFAIAGKGFRGAADADRVFLGDQPCLVVASSPVSLVVLPGPHIPIGAIALRVSAEGRDTGPIAVTGVLLDIGGPAETPTVGAEGKLILRVHGTTEPLAIEVHNASPEIIQLLHGNPQRVETSGGEENIAPVELKFLASGNYAVTARLVPADSASPQGGN